jgi:hypothetical protein
MQHGNPARRCILRDILFDMERQARRFRGAAVFAAVQHNHELGPEGSVEEGSLAEGRGTEGRGGGGGGGGGEEGMDGGTVHVLWVWIYVHRRTYCAYPHACLRSGPPSGL